MSLMRDYPTDFRGLSQEYNAEMAKELYCSSIRDAEQRGLLDKVPVRLAVNAEESSNARDVARLLARRIYGKQEHEYDSLPTDNSTIDFQRARKIIYTSKGRFILA